MTSDRVVLYFAGALPSRSETFIYREIFALRDAGLRVFAVTLRPSQNEFADQRIHRLKQETRVVYSGGPFHFIRDAVRFAIGRPAAAARALALCARDLLTGRGITPRDRAKLPVQALAALAVAQRVPADEIAHVHAHFAHAPATTAMYFATALQIPFSFTGHANDIFERRSLLAAKLRRAAFVACISSWHRDFYRRLVDRSDAEMPVIRCGVDLAASVPPPEQRSGVLAVGRLVEKKGFDTLIEAVAYVRSEGRNVPVSIIGDGPDAAMLRRLAASRGVDDLFRFRGAAEHTDVIKACHAASIFCLPCKVDRRGDRDGIPVVLMEAMAAGCCAIAGDHPAIRELITDGCTGRLVPPGDAASLAKAINRLLEQPEEASALAQAGRAFVAKEFSTPVNIARLINAFNWTLGADRLIGGVPVRAASCDEDASIIQEHADCGIKRSCTA